MGSVPICLVAPAPPALELLVDGVPQTVVRPGDALLTTCHAKTGNPVPDVQISFAGETSAPMNFKNSLLVTVPEGHEELEVSCTASNSAGSATETATVSVHSPSSVLRNSVHQFQCQVQGGFPKPEVTWIVADSERDERREKMAVSPKMNPSSKSSRFSSSSSSLIPSILSLLLALAACLRHYWAYLQNTWV